MEATVTKIKNQLKKEIDGKVMVRKSNKYKNLEKEGIFDFDVYFNTPTPRNKEMIKIIIESHGCQPFNFRIIGGVYGYVIPFRLKRS